MKPLPAHVALYQKTPEFDENTMPHGLTHDHQTQAPVWAKVVVLEGRLQYTIDGPGKETLILDEHTSGVVEPMVPHEVKPLGKVRFYVEFYR
ncbi:MAG: DUF1971 domain-containing protein [Rhodocyclaceae bacterium]|nr:DUF1971 domain-containing protein [Rhodocyclaceae bacterium]